jgi:1-acyl-sn-glycerol-3-phosphate acyltransferase
VLRWLAYKSTVWFLRSPFLPFSRVRELHRERSRLAGPCIFAPNHISHFDPPFLATLVRRHVAWMTTAGLLSSRFIGAWLRTIGCFPVDRAKADRASVRTTIELLRQGKMVGIFRELLRADGDDKAARASLEKRYCEAMRALCREMVAHFRLTEDDLPKPPKERMARKTA